MDFKIEIELNIGITLWSLVSATLTYLTFSFARTTAMVYASK